MSKQLILYKEKREGHSLRARGLGTQAAAADSQAEVQGPLGRKEALGRVLPVPWRHSSEQQLKTPRKATAIMSEAARAPPGATEARHSWPSCQASGMWTNATFLAGTWPRSLPFNCPSYFLYR